MQIEIKHREKRGGWVHPAQSAMSMILSRGVVDRIPEGVYFPFVSTAGFREKNLLECPYACIITDLGCNIDKDIFRYSRRVPAHSAKVFLQAFGDDRDFRVSQMP